MPFCRIIKFLIINLLLQLSEFAGAQNNDIKESPELSELFEELAFSEIESSDAEEVSEDLSWFIEHPLNLNEAGEEELRKLHLLNDFQIYTLLEYIREAGPVLSINELQTIIGFSADISGKLEPYITCDPPPAKTVRPGRLKQELVIKAASDFEKYKNTPGREGDNATHKGSNRSITTRYQIRSGNTIHAGLVIDQDPGESFKPPGRSFQPDFISAFAEVKRKGFLHHLIIGDFRASYGQGLVLSGYTQRKGAGVLIKPGNSGIRKYSSAGENNLFRGMAVALKHEDLSLELFFSSVKMDATLYEDSCKYFRSLLLTGYHRTEAELKKKDAVLMKSFAVHAGIKKARLDLGMTFLNQEFDADYVISIDPFLSMRLKKNDPLWNFGTDYRLNLGKMILSGEIASDQSGRIAILNGILAKLHPLISYSFLYRNYHRTYLGLKSGGFGEKSRTRNEEGFYHGLEMYIGKYLKMDIFADHYRFPFPDVLSTGPVRGNEYLLNCRILPVPDIELNLRTRYERKDERSDRPGTGIDFTGATRKISERLEFRFTIPGGLFLKSRTEFSYYNKPGTGWTKGYYSGNDLGYENKNKTLRLWMRYAVFDIPDWDNRIYAYENDILHSFSTPVYNNSGIRTVFLAKISLLKKLEFWFRYSITMYNRKKQIESSGSQPVNNNSPYLSVQLRFKI